MTAFDTPLLLIIWRRPDALRQLIQAIRQVRPISLFVACDGPRLDRPRESDKVAACRLLIENSIDWPCQIKTLYSSVNLGCRLGVSQAIDWFFDNVEEGIILEDDCIPHSDFFYYSAALLKRYRHDTRIWSISGNNFQDGRCRGAASYYFSRYSHCWGWATWRRCWDTYDSTLSEWPAIRDSSLLCSILVDSAERRYWKKIWNRLYLYGKPNTWDYQWTFSCMINNGLTVLPNVNLVDNIGFGLDATHTHQASGLPRTPGVDGLGLQSIPLVHPDFIVADREADLYTFYHHFKGTYPSRILNRLARLNPGKRL